MACILEPLRHCFLQPYDPQQVTLAGVPLQRCDLESWRSIMAAPGMQELHDKAQPMGLSEGQLCQVFQANPSVTSTVSMNCPQ